MSTRSLLFKALIAYLAFVNIVSAAQTRDVDELLVIGVDLDQNAPSCYPIEILNYHEIVNNVEILGHSYSVTYSPLTGSNIVLNTSTLLGKKSLGHSGRVYQDNLVMYDGGTKSWWSQILRESVKGTLIKNTLPGIPSVLTKWSTWKSLYNNTAVLSRATGYKYNYNNNPYPGYSDEASSRIMFPCCYSSYKDAEPYKSHNSKPKEWTFIVQTDAESGYALFPYSELVRESKLLQVTNTTQRRYTLINFGTSSGNDKPFFVFYDEEKQLTRAWSSVINGETRSFYTNNEIGVPENLPTYGLMTLRDDRQNVWNMRGIAIMGHDKGMKLKQLYSFTAYWFAASSFFPTAKILKSGLLVESKPSVTCIPGVNHTVGSPFYDSEGQFCEVPCNMLVVAGAQDEVPPINSPEWTGAAGFEAYSRLPPNVTQFFVTWAVVFGVFLAVLAYYLWNKYRKNPQHPGMNKTGSLVTIDEGEEMMNEIELTGFNDEDNKVNGKRE